MEVIGLGMILYFGVIAWRYVVIPVFNALIPASTDDQSEMNRPDHLYQAESKGGRAFGSHNEAKEYRLRELKLSRDPEASFYLAAYQESGAQDLLNPPGWRDYRWRWKDWADFQNSL